MYLQVYVLVGSCLCFYTARYPGVVEALVGDVRPAMEHEFPFIVAISKAIVRTKPTGYFCAGSLISRKDILTSEHCMEDEHVNEIHVLVGSSYLDRGTKHYPLWWITFNQWAVKTYYQLNDTYNDVAILHLIQEVPSYIVPPHIYAFPSGTVSGLKMQTAGWGALYDNSIPNILHVGVVTIISRKECEERLTRLLRGTTVGDDRIICSFSKPYILLREGDSGGPLFYKNLLVGINYGTAPISSVQVHPDKVNVFVHIGYYYDFVSELRGDY